MRHILLIIAVASIPIGAFANMLDGLNTLDIRAAAAGKILKDSGFEVISSEIDGGAITITLEDDGTTAEAAIQTLPGPLQDGVVIVFQPASDYANLLRKHTTSVRGFPDGVIPSYQYYQMAQIYLATQGPVTNRLGRPPVPPSTRDTDTLRDVRAILKRQKIEGWDDQSTALGIYDLLEATQAESEVIAEEKLDQFRESLSDEEWAEFEQDATNFLQSTVRHTIDYKAVIQENPSAFLKTLEDGE